MSHFAEISGSGSGSITYTVTRVIVAEQDFINSGAVGNPSKWIRTSYNTYGGVHYEPNSKIPSPVNYQDASGSSYTTLEEANASGSGTITPVSQSITLALRKNYAGIGYIYNTGSDAFIAPKPFDSWTLNETSCLWEAPVSIPDDDKMYSWNENSGSWVEV